MVNLLTIREAKKQAPASLFINWADIERQIAWKLEERRKVAAITVSRVSLLVYGALALSIGIGLLVK